MKKWLLFICLLPLVAVGQNKLLQQAISHKYAQPDSAILLARKFIATQDARNAQVGEAFHTLAVAYWIKGEYIDALDASYQGLNLFNNLQLDTGISKMYNDIGLNFWKLKDRKNAMTNYLNALDHAERSENDPTLARVLGNIGILYEEQQDYDKALEYQQRCLNLAEKNRDERLLSNTLNNIALIYNKKNALAKAELFAKRCLTLRKKLNDENGQAQALNLLGIIAQDTTQYKRADTLFHQAFEIYKRTENIWGQAMVLGNIGTNYYQLGRYSEGVKNCYLSYELSVAYNLEWKESACQCIAEGHANLGEATLSNQWWNKWKTLQDSIYSHNLRNDISLLQQRFEHEKIEASLKYENELTEAEVKRQRQLRNASIGIGMLALILFFVLFSNYRSKQRDNELLEKMNSEISEQKAVIEEKNEHITDSIRYAQQLQNAILPKHAAFEGRFDRHFILYHPKDIVSGDFYWLEEANGKTFVAVADCTGHGVPGAMVSMVGYQGLNKAVREKQLSKPSEILQSLSDHVEEQFEKSGGSVRDGMDIALFAISKDQKHLTFAGAHNPLLLVSKRTEVPNCTLKEQQGDWNMFEVKADRRSIGGYFDAGPFTDHEIGLQKGDTIFMFSDGYADQFGGPNDKKLGIRRLRNVLLQAVVDNDLYSLEPFYLEWKGPSEQIDDVSLIGLTI